MIYLTLPFSPGCLQWLTTALPVWRWWWRKPYRMFPRWWRTFRRDWDVWNTPTFIYNFISAPHNWRNQGKYMFKQNACGTPNGPWSFQLQSSSLPTSYWADQLGTELNPGQIYSSSICGHNMYVCVWYIILFCVWITVLSETIAVDGKARAGLPSRRMLWDILKPQASAVSIDIQFAWHY